MLDKDTLKGVAALHNISLLYEKTCNQPLLRKRHENEFKKLPAKTRMKAWFVFTYVLIDGYRNPQSDIEESGLIPELFGIDRTDTLNMNTFIRSIVAVQNELTLAYTNRAFVDELGNGKNITDRDRPSAVQNRLTYLKPVIKKMAIDLFIHKYESQIINDRSFVKTNYDLLSGIRNAINKLFKLEQESLRTKSQALISFYKEDANMSEYTKMLIYIIAVLGASNMKLLNTVYTNTLKIAVDRLHSLLPQEQYPDSVISFLKDLVHTGDKYGALIRLKKTEIFRMIRVVSWCNCRLPHDILKGTEYEHLLQETETSR